MAKTGFHSNKENKIKGIKSLLNDVINDDNQQLLWKIWS